MTGIQHKKQSQGSWQSKPYLEQMANKKKVKGILKDCNYLTFSNLKLYFTSEISEKDLKPYYFNHYIEAYILSNFRLSTLSGSLDGINDIKEKKVEVFLTSNKVLYQDILKQEGMLWVKLKQKFGFVLYSINICYIDHEVLTRYLPPRSFELDSMCHEFTHILLPQYLNMNREEFSKYWNRLFDEGFAVLLNKQYRYTFNMQKDLESNAKYNLQKISLEYLRKNGLFKLDDRFVDENFGYQYCASIVKSIDDRIREEEGYISKIPLSGIFTYLSRQERKGESVEEDLRKDFNIIIKDIERNLRAELSMK